MACFWDTAEFESVILNTLTSGERAFFDNCWTNALKECIEDICDVASGFDRTEMQEWIEERGGVFYDLYIMIAEHRYIRGAHQERFIEDVFMTLGGDADNF